MNQETKAKLEAIGDALWQRTKRDWILDANTILTEPVCPSATIRCEDKDAKYQYWAAHADTIEEAIEQVAEIAHAALFEGFEGNGVPWTEPTLKKVPSA